MSSIFEMILDKFYSEKEIQLSTSIVSGVVSITNCFFLFSLGIEFLTSEISLFEDNRKISEKKIQNLSKSKVELQKS